MRWERILRWRNERPTSSPIKMVIRIEDGWKVSGVVIIGREDGQVLELEIT